MLANGHEVDWKPNLKTGEDEELGPIHLAVRSGELEMVKSIIHLKPESLEAKTSHYKSSPLHVASVYCHPEILEYLLLKKSDLNYQNTKGNTALILSLANKCTSASIILIEYGADPNIKNKENKTAFNYLRDKDKYLITRKKKKSFREIASSSELEELPKLQPPKLLHPQK